MVSVPPRPSAAANISKTLEPEAYYEVMLWKPVEIAGKHHLPGQRIIMKGALVDEHRDSVSSAVKESSSGLV